MMDSQASFSWFKWHLKSFHNDNGLDKKKIKNTFFKK